MEYISKDRILKLIKSCEGYTENTFDFGYNTACKELYKKIKDMEPDNEEEDN